MLCGRLWAMLVSERPRFCHDASFDRSWFDRQEDARLLAPGSYIWGRSRQTQRQTL